MHFNEHRALSRPVGRFKQWVAGWVLFFWATAAVGAGFVLTDTQGRTHRLEDYRGQWVLVNFWATWCPPCLDEIPDLNDLYEAHKGRRLLVLGVAMDYQSGKQVMDFAQSLSVAYPIVLGNQKIAAQIGAVNALPTTYLYNPQGKLVAYNVGPLTKEAVERYMAKP